MHTPLETRLKGTEQLAMRIIYIEVSHSFSTANVLQRQISTLCEQIHKLDSTIGIDLLPANGAKLTEL